MARVMAAAGLLFLSGCAGLPPREPTTLSNGMLVARARVRGALLGFTSDLADSATLEQLGPHGEPVPGKEAVAGVLDEGQVYFLDLPPGRYALTSVSFRARGVRYRVQIPPAVWRKEPRTTGGRALGPCPWAHRRSPPPSRSISTRSPRA